MVAACASLMSPAPDSTATQRDVATTVTRRGAVLVACAAICWSSGALIARLVTTDPWTTNLWRSLFASLFLALVLRLVWGRGIVAQWRGPVIPVAVCMAVSSTCFIFSLALTSVANTLILMSTGPYVAGLLGWLLLGERVPLRTWLTMGVALAGAVIMVSSSPGRGALLGDVLAIVMAGSFAVATVLVRRHPEVRMAPAAVLATALTCLVALPQADPLATGARDIALLAFFGVGQFGAGFLLFMAGARLIPAAQTSLIGMLEIVLGPLWVWLALGERPVAASRTGGALILTALLTNTLVDLVTPGRARAAPGPRGRG
ncbi:MAG: DMT family transporter [Candidatus Rokuibacteriota bacterium]|nr:MAG: DMT family transporter [Candidatus Rokubacteria bacterium]